MKTKIQLVFCLALFCFLQLMFAQKILLSSNSKSDSDPKRTNGQFDSSCPIGEATNPSPPTGAMYVPITGVTLNWTNGTGTVNVEVWFGPIPDVVKIYDGSAITSYALPTLNNLTTYRWYIVCKDEICGTQGMIWTFTSIPHPNSFPDTIDVYPQDSNYWTGTCDSSTKTEVSLVKGYNIKLGWMVFDISAIPYYASIGSVMFNGYVYSDNWPYWSITPMDNVNPLTDDASAIYNQVITHYEQGVAYSYNEESGTIPNGWLSRGLSNSAEIDLSNALSQDWFAIGIVDWDFSALYYIEFQGWAEENEPYLRVTLDFCLSCLPPNAPSNLTAQIIYNPDPQVQLNWQDNSSDEDSFGIYRKFGYPSDPGNYEWIGIVQANVTQFLNTTVMPESTYTYRVFAYNWFGSNGSNTATITVPIPVELISFTCEVEEDVVNLFWQTATETNNSGFEIERSQTSNVKSQTDWERIGFVEGKGTTTEIQSYSFQDKPEAGKYKYRLKQIDFDGSYEYSQEIEAEVKPPLVFSLEQNYPNPFNPITKIKYSVGANSNSPVQIKVYDVLGNEIVTLVNEEQPAGKYEVEFSTESSFRLVRNLVSGIYFYQLKAGNFIETKKMILLR